MKKYLVICLLALLGGNAIAQDSLGMRKVGSLYNCWSTLYQLEVHDGKLLVNHSGANLQVLDISNPPECPVLGQSERWLGDPIILEGDRAYAHRNDSIWIYDIANLPDFVLEGVYTLDNANSFTVSEGILYHRDTIYENWRHVSILRVVDLNDPANPQELGFTRRISADNMVVRGNLLYCRNIRPDGDRYRFTVFDVSDPDSIRMLDESFGINSFNDIEIQGNFAYVASYDTSLIIFDISDPENIACLSVLNHIGFIWQINIIDNYVYTTGNILASIDISDPVHPVVADSIADLWGRCQAIKDNVLMVASANSPHLKFIDISDPTDLRLIGERRTLVHANSVISSGNIVYTLFGEGGLGIADVSDPANPVELSILPLIDGPSTEGQFIRRGSSLFCYCREQHNGWRGLKVVNVSNPREPEIVWTDTLGSITDMDIHGDYLYLTKGRDGLDIWDASDPADVVQVGRLDPPGTMSDISVMNNYAYISLKTTNADSLPENTHDLVTFDISSPEDPQEVSRVRILYNATTEMAIRPQNLYLLGSDSLRSYSLADPAAPRPTGGFQVGRYDCSDFVCVNDDYLILGGLTLGVLSLKDEFGRSRMPVKIGNYDNPGRCRDLAVEDNLLLVADDYTLGIYDISEAIKWQGVEPSETDLPQSFSLLAAYPNPFNETVLIQYSIPVTSKVRLAVFDVSGRLVSEIFDQERKIGRYQAVWNGGGTAAGLYFLRLEAPGFVKSYKLMLIK